MLISVSAPEDEGTPASAWGQAPGVSAVALLDFSFRRLCHLPQRILDKHQRIPRVTTPFAVTGPATLSARTPRRGRAALSRDRRSGSRPVGGVVFSGPGEQSAWPDGRS